MSLAMISWGIAWTNAKILNEFLGYYNLVFLRFFFGFIAILPFIYKKTYSLKGLSKKSLINILSMGLFFFIYNYCFFKGTDLGKSGMGGVFVTTTNPIITFIIISFISKKITNNQIIGIILGCIGGFIIMDIFNLGINNIFDMKNRYFVFCSIIWGLMTVIMSYGQKEIDSIIYIGICYFVTTLICIPFININELSSIDFFNTKFLINFFFASIGAMAFGTSIYIYYTPRLGPIQTSAFIFSVPFIALFTAFLVLGEPISINVIVGGIISIISIYIINKK
tara:strand:- start:950 stop:1789 length:840 start_codon:yes stop_codon:yes gene_type:complete